MECARIAAQRGHEVTIYEKEKALGGTFLAASVAKNKDAERRLLAWYKLQLKNTGVKVKYNTELTLSDVEKLNCDEIIVSTGNKPKMPPIPGIKQENVYNPVKVLLGEEILPKGRVIIIGGGVVGCELAVWLTEEKGFDDVTVIEGAEDLMAGGFEPMPLPNKLMLIDLMKFYGVKVLTSTMLDHIDGDKVYVRHCGDISALETDSVVLSLGSAANDKLYKQINETIPKKVWLLGDAKMPSNIMFGIRDANAIAREL